MLVWLASIMTADILITCSILWALIRSKTGWAHTDKVSGDQIAARIS